LAQKKNSDLILARKKGEKTPTADIGSKKNGPYAVVLKQRLLPRKERGGDQTCHPRAKKRGRPLFSTPASTKSEYQSKLPLMKKGKNRSGGGPFEKCDMLPPRPRKRRGNIGSPGALYVQKKVKRQVFD